MGIFIPASRNSFSRIFVTVVNLCALVNGGQHLFFFVRVLDGVCVCVFFVAVGRVLRTAISECVSIFFGAIKIRNS